MALPLSTTTVSIHRPGADADFYEPSTTETLVASGVRAVFSEPSGLEKLAGGREEATSFPFACDPVSIAGDDEVVDESTGERYEVLWAKHRPGMGLDHVVGRVRRVTGGGR